MLPKTGEAWAAWGLLALLALAPVLTGAFDQPFLLDLATRLMIIAIAAVSLNLILGYGGMVSFGHAAFLGIGAYCVGIPAYYDIFDGWVHLLLALAVGALRLITGAMSLRTKGVHFIMITMAFAQMVYFLFVSLEEYGADDGLLIYERSAVPFLDLHDTATFYYVCWGSLILALFLVHRMVHARFGMVICRAPSNERRMQALGFPTFRYRLAAYMIAGDLRLCGRAVGQLHQLHQPGDDGLDPLGRADLHGRARRHWAALSALCSGSRSSFCWRSISSRSWTRSGLRLGRLLALRLRPLAGAGGAVRPRRDLGAVEGPGPCLRSGGSRNPSAGWPRPIRCRWMSNWARSTR